MKDEDAVNALRPLFAEFGYRLREGLAPESHDSANATTRPNEKVTMVYETQTTKQHRSDVLAHELSHIVLNDEQTARLRKTADENPWAVVMEMDGFMTTYARVRAEVEAELSAGMVLAHFGIDDSVVQRYIANWTEDGVYPDVVQQATPNARKAAVTIIAHLGES